MGQCYGQLSLEERVEIYRLHAGGKSQNEMGSALDRPPATIGRELRRTSRPTKLWTGGYEPVRAQQLAERRRQWDGRFKLARQPDLRNCGTAWAKALRWDIPRSRSPADWRANMVASSSAMSQSIVSSITVRRRRITGTACCRVISSDDGVDAAQPGALPALSNNGAPY